MPLGFLPNADAALLAWSTRFSNLITATPTAFGLTAVLATNYAAVHTAFATALAACEPNIRTRAAVVTKNQARETLKVNARLLSNLVNGTASVTDAQKLTLGLTVRTVPVPTPIPASSPTIEIGVVNGWAVSIKLRDSASGTKRGKPKGVSGASVFSYVGAEPSNDISKWKFEGNTGATAFEVTFPGALAAGTQVWLTAFWFNGRKQAGVASAPVSTRVQGGGMARAA